MSYPPAPYQQPLPNTAPQVDRSDVRRGWQLAAGIGVFVLSQLLTGVPLLLWALSTGQEPTAAVGMVESVLVLVGMFVGAAASVGGYLLIVHGIGARPGLGLRGGKAAFEFVTGLGVGAGLVAVSVGIIWLLGGYQVHGFNAGPQLAASLLLAVGIGIGPGFMEEILFRGFLFRLMDACWGWLPALLITSAVFGAVHLTNPEATVFGAVAIALEAGVLLGAAYLITRRLWSAIGIHTAWNFVQAGIFSSDVSGTGDQQGLLNATWDGPAWLTGGQMGMEASVVTLVVALGAGIVMLLVARSHGMLLGPAPKKRASRQATDAAGAPNMPAAGASTTPAYPAQPEA